MKQKAFSLIELSIVILIIGILIAGVTQSSRLVARMRLTTARTLTQSSPVAGIKDLHSWFEATSNNSFDDIETQDGSTVTNWYDINPQSISKIIATQATIANKPIYKDNSLNGLPTLSFDGAASFLKATINPPTLFGYSQGGTVFLVFNANTTAAQRFLVMQPVTNCANNIEIGLTTGNQAQGNFGIHSGCNHASVTPAGTIVVNQPTIISLVMLTSPITSGSTANTLIYQNGGNPLALNADVSGYNFGLNGTYATGTAPFHIGARDSVNNGAIDGYFSGQIAEIVIFTRALKNEERIAVQAYLGKKWGIKVN
jgi:prepilin-type N-terminal cleavage/methylation domain-containing protein